MCHPLMGSEQEFLYQFFVRNVLSLNELNNKTLHPHPTASLKMLQFLYLTAPHLPDYNLSLH